MDKKLFETLTPDFFFNDERGFLYQLCHDDWKQINVSKTIAGTFRGGHYHKNTKEAFFIIDGEVSVLLEKDHKKEEIIFKTGDFFLINPYVVHSFTFNKDSLMVALYDIGVEKQDGTKDIFKKGEI